MPPVESPNATMVPVNASWDTDTRAAREKFGDGFVPGRLT